VDCAAVAESDRERDSVFSSSGNVTVEMQAVKIG
jgi:hypothetical protein